MDEVRGFRPRGRWFFLLLGLFGLGLPLPLPQARGEDKTHSQGRASKAIRRVDSLEPWEVVEGKLGEVTLQGRGFRPDVKVRVGNVTVAPESLKVSPSSITISLPTGVPPGLHSVRLEWEDGVQLCSRWPLAVRQKTCQVSTIPFAKGSWDLEGTSADPGAARAMNEALACLSRGAPQNIIVLGFASREGDAALNNELSRKRSEIVASKIALHLPQQKVTRFGLGEVLPVSLGEHEGALAPNRRVLVLSADAKPCQAVRLFVDAVGTLSPASSAVLQSEARCFASNGVTSALLVGAEPTKGGLSEKQINGLVQRIRSEIGLTTVGAPRTVIDPAFGTPAERAALAKLFNLTDDSPSGTFVELYPLAWASTNTGVMTTPDIGCPYETIISENDGTLSSTAQNASVLGDGANENRGGVSFKSGTLFALEQTHIGLGVQVDGVMLSFGNNKNWRLLGVGGGSAFFGENPYRIASDMGSRLLARVGGGPGIDFRAGRLRFELDATGGIVLPTARAGYFMGDATGAFRVGQTAEVLLTFGAGGLLFKDTAEAFTQVQFGGGWWF